MLCIVREELAELAQQLPQRDPELGEAVKNRSSLLAPSALAFLQRLMVVPDPLQRCVGSCGNGSEWFCRSLACRGCCREMPNGVAHSLHCPCMPDRVLCGVLRPCACQDLSEDPGAAGWPG